MFGFRGRGGPSRATPANVQCQKCLKRGHYSYECKASSQDRPYVSRPSRTQQMRNPKLVPKLDSDTPKPLENKKGVADEELAKREAERTRKRELEERGDRMALSASRRQRSTSADSASSTDTRSASSRTRSRSRSPPPRKGRRAPSRGPESDGEIRDAHYGSRSVSPAPAPPRRRRSSDSRDSRSPPPKSRHHQSYRSREPVSPIDDESDRMPRRRRRYSINSAASRDSRPRHRHLSRSPDANRRSVDPPASSRGRRDGRRPDSRAQQEPAAEPRERSLSPFSKRLALTRGTDPGRG